MTKAPPPPRRASADTKEKCLLLFGFARARFFLNMERTFFFGVLPSKFSGRWRGYSFARTARHSSPQPPPAEPSSLKMRGETTKNKIHTDGSGKTHYKIAIIKVMKHLSTLRLATAFSGIGAIEHALKRMRVKHELVFACDNDPHVKQSYFANYNIDDSRWFDPAARQGNL